MKLPAGSLIKNDWLFKAGKRAVFCSTKSTLLPVVARLEVKQLLPTKIISFPSS